MTPPDAARASTSPLPSPVTSPTAAIFDIFDQGPALRTRGPKPTTPSVGRIRIDPVVDIATRSGQPEPTRLVRSGSCIVGCVVAAKGVWFGAGTPSGGGSAGSEAGSVGPCAAFSIACAALRTDGILAYR